MAQSHRKKQQNDEQGVPLEIDTHYQLYGSMQGNRIWRAMPELQQADR